MRAILAATGRRRFFGIGLLATIGPVVAEAQTLPSRHYSSTDGLAHDTVGRVSVDSRGFVWFGTIAGASRFDGREFITYSMEDGLPDTVVNQVFEDSNGDLWFATNGGGLARLEPTRHRPSRFDVVPVGPSRRSNRVNRLLEAPAQQLWAATDDGLFVGDLRRPTQFRRVPLEPAVEATADVQILAAAASSTGLWVGTTHGLLRIPIGQAAGRSAAVRALPGRISAVTLTSDGRVWAARNDGVVAFTPDRGGADHHQWTDLRPCPHDQSRWHLPTHGGRACLLHGLGGSMMKGAWTLDVARDGSVLVGTLDGRLVEIRNGRPRLVWQAPGAEAIGSVLSDQHDNLWLTSRVGVWRLPRTGLDTWMRPAGEGPAQIQGLVEHGPGRVLGMGYQGWGVRAAATHAEATRPEAVRQAYTASMVYQSPLLDSHGQWWVGTAHGLFRFGALPFEQLRTARPLAVYRRKDGLPSDLVGRLFEDSRGDIWMATRGLDGEVLARWTRASGRIRTFTPAQGVPPFSVPTAFAEDASGRVWMTFWDGGVGFVAAGDRFQPIDDPRITATPFHAIYFDARHRLWLAPRGRGIFRVDAPDRRPWVIRRYAQADGLASENIACFTEGPDGLIYAGGNRGVERLDPIGHHIVLVADSHLLGGPQVGACVTDSTGHLWFGGDGLSRLRPGAGPDASPPSVWITAVRPGGEASTISELGVQDAGFVELPPSRRSVQIAFVGVDRARDGSVRYQTRLLGSDDRWSPATADRSVTLAGLAPGRYRFEVRGVSASGAVSELAGVVAVIVPPTLWESRWVRAGLIAGGLALVFAVYRYRLAELVRVERVRTRIARDLHDDIGADLAQIAMLAAIVRRDVAPDRPALSDHLGTIIETASRLVDAMSDIVWALNPARDSAADPVNRMRRFVHDTLGAIEVAYCFEAPDGLDRMTLGADVRRTLLLVLKEAVHNIVKHAHCRSARIRLEFEGRWLTLTVADDGQGFDPSSRSDGTGLSSLRARVSAAGGSLLVRSAPGAGTTIRARVRCR